MLKSSEDIESCPILAAEEQAAPIKTQIEIPALFQRIHTTLSEDINQPFSFTRSCSFDHLLAMAGSISMGGMVILDFGLAYPEGGIAVASLAAFFGFIQVLTLSQMTLSHYFTPLRNFINQLKKSSSHSERFQIVKQKIPKFILLTIFHEIPKWWILYSASAVEPSLASEVSWLNNAPFKQYLQLTAMMLSEPVVRGHIQAIIEGTMGLCTPQKPRQFQQPLLDLINIRFQHLLDASPEELKALITPLTGSLSPSENDCPENADIFWAFLFSEKNTPTLPTFLSQLAAHYFIPLLKKGLFCIYLYANTGAYHATFHNAGIPFFNRVTSIAVDALFGYFMTSLVIQELISAFRRRNPLNLAKNEWPFFGLSIGCVGIAACTISNSINVNQKEGMPNWVIVPTIISVTINNSLFLIQWMRKLYLQFLLLLPKDSNRLHNRAITERLHRLITRKISHLSSEELEVLVAELKNKHPDLSEQVAIKEASQISWKQRVMRYGFAMLATGIAALNFLIPQSENKIFLDEYLFSIMAPLLSLSGSFILTRIFQCCAQRNKKAGLEAENACPKEKIATPAEEDPSLRGLSTIEIVIVSLAPTLIGTATESITHFFLTKLFDVEPDAAKQNSHLLGKAAAALTSGIITGQILRRLLSPSAAKQIAPILPSADAYSPSRANT